jgi:hypothetical protein
MLLISCGLPWLVSVPSLSRMICGCCRAGGQKGQGWVGAGSGWQRGGVAGGRRHMPAAGHRLRLLGQHPLHQLRHAHHPKRHSLHRGGVLGQGAKRRN